MDYLDISKYDLNRDGATHKINKIIKSTSPVGSLTRAMRLAYNEGYKQALSDISVTPDWFDAPMNRIIEEVDLVDNP
jgi:hypothetical protein